MRADEQQFHEFVAARSRALGRTAYLLTGDHHLAEDLLQTALLQVARHWERIDGHPEAYARRVLYTQNVSWWRRKRFAERSLESYDDRAAASSDPTLRLTLADALGRLTTKQRTVLVLRFYEDLTEVQTAAALGITAGTVKSTTRQALARLRTLAPELADLVGAGEAT
ncbi:SigE family RNA polymerase sigma factor [Nocardioides campestrisoli]|uniref:SigE family RNA polymerase sigma factor n=1 Tax=Nocardioides campestrisoli TaxID=2736757 RepID=UPI0015E6F94A|nr:SigE family RNA polymerase sigma factor [Nocardioides campestrisoli]